MSEQIAQLRSFGNYVVRNDLMNSDTNSIVERSTGALNNLREQIAKLAKQAHYEAYKENFQASSPLEVPEDVVEDFTDKFTVKNFKEDLRSVFPVLYRLMQEESTIGYDDIVAMTAEDQETNEDVELDTSYDPFEKFESWAMNLGEASGITSEDDEERSMAVQHLQKLMNEEFPAGVDGSNAIESIKGIIEDPSLFKEIKDAATEDPQADIRPLIRAWLEENAQGSLEDIDFGDTTLPGEEEVEEKFDPSTTKHTPYTPDQIRKYNKWANLNGQMEYDPDRMFPGSVGDKMIFVGNKGAESIPVEVVALDPDYPEGVKIRSLDGSDIPGWGEPEAEIDWMTSKNVPILKPMQGESDDDRYSAKKSDIPAYQRKAKGGDDWKLTQKDLEKEKERNISSKEWLKKKSNESMDVQELAEFISSFYDKDSGTFPKGPEGVCTMVGKKFGEQAEQVARKFVERMAPQQADPALQELSDETNEGWGADEYHLFQNGYTIHQKKQTASPGEPGFLLYKTPGAKTQQDAEEMIQGQEPMGGYSSLNMALDAVKKLEQGGSKESMELEAIRRLSGISQGMGY
jgi:hypothetical protein